MDGKQLLTVLEGLELNGLLGGGEDGSDGGIESVLTGYIGSVSFLESIVDVLERVRKHNPSATFVCDPVLGDDGRFYVPEELVEPYRSIVIPKADVVTPNQFEAEQLTGIAVETIAGAEEACRKLHAMGPSVVFITSAVFGGDERGEGATITIVASKLEGRGGKEIQRMWRIDCPKIPGSFTGTGDVTASLLLGNLLRTPDDMPLVMEKVVNTMYVLIERTHALQGSTPQSKELRLIQSKDVIEDPPSTYKARALEIC